MFKLKQAIVIFFVIIKFYSVSLAIENQDATSSGLKLTQITKYNDLPENSIYNTIINYSKEKPFGDQYGRNTNAHETVHGINSYLRNKYFKELKQDVNGFYAGEGFGIILKNPKLTLRQVKNYIPNCVRGYRFNLYFEKQLVYWDDTPTYPIDEWSAYVAGAECSVDDFNNGIIYSEKCDSVSGTLEFSIYCVCLAKCIKEVDRKYWDENPQFKATIKFYLIKSERVFFQGKDIFPSKKQDILLNSLRNDEDAQDIRDFLMEEFDGIFVK